MTGRPFRSAGILLTAIAAAAITTVAIAPGSAAADAEWTVSGSDGPLTAAATLDGGLLRVQAYPGARTPGTVVITVPTPDPRTFTIEAEGLSSPAGTPVVGPPIGPEDAAHWLTLPETTATAAQDNPATVMFAVAAPESATPGDHAAALTITDATGETRQIGVIIRVPLPQETTGPVPTLSLDTADLTVADDALPFTRSDGQLRYTATNTGPTALVGEFSVGVQTLFGTRIETRDARRAVVLLPGGSITGTTDLHLPPTVRRTPFAAVTVDYTDQSGRRTNYAVSAFGSTIDVVPIAELGTALGVLTAAGAGWTLYRRRRIRRSAAARDEGKGTPAPM